ncbi:Alcohol acetyltransferase [Diatrype stigma]|uniref:Alcohol acetyltransferase n=1 Tax=Diatrype stigma TaxID=117547 RepID=A0AAN9V7V2_9PEZI
MAQAEKLTISSEAFQQAMANRDEYRGTVLACRYAVPPELAGSDSSTQLMNVIESAVAQVVLRHPLLHVGIKRADTKLPVWVRLDSIDLGPLIEWKFPDASADMASLVYEITDAELNSGYKNIESQPGWKLVILHKPASEFLDVVFNFNHVTTDGIGARVFHEDLLECLNNYGTEGEGMAKPHISDHILQLPEPSVEFPPPVEKLCKMQVDISFIIKLLWAEKRPAMFCNNDTQANWAPVRGPPYNTRFRSFRIEPGSLAALLVLCRKHNTTITGLLHSLTLVSLASQITTAPGFQSGSPLDLRRFLPTDRPKHPELQSQPPERTICNYVSMADHEFPVGLIAELRSKLLPTGASDADAEADAKDEGLLPAGIKDLVWSIAAKVRADLREKLALGTRNDMLGVAKFIKDWHAHLKEVAQKPRQQSWHVSTLGIIEGTPKKPEAEAGETPDKTGSSGGGGGWSIRDAEFIISAEVPTAPIMITPVTARDGPLSVSCSWQDNVVDASVAEKLVVDLEKWLNQLATSS